MDTADGRPFPSVIFPDKTQKEIKLLMQTVVFQVQDAICKEIQKLEECKTFTVKKWNRPEGAEGITKFLEDGDVFEKVVICAARASGILPSSAYHFIKNDEDKDYPPKITYFTCGVNGIFYPRNPHVPILSFNYRYFEMSDGLNIRWWFGGGTDLMPCILNKEDCQYFHKILKQCCDKYDADYYKTFKKNCDDYFYLEHRGERRGVGGIFFNELNHPSLDICFQFVKTCMQNIIPSYVPIVIKNMDKKYFSQDKEWQHSQRGRYVEFNLICDKATKLVLMTPGVEYENILMCLPPSAKWHFCSYPEKSSKEFELVNILRNPIEWV